MTSAGPAAGLLLDTHVALWVAGDDTRIDAATRRLLDEPGGPVYISAVSIAEIAIKSSLGKLAIPGPASELIVATGCEPLDLTAGHADLLVDLPPLHRDPFDRLLLCQAQAEDLVLVTADRQIHAYTDVRVHRVN